MICKFCGKTIESGQSRVCHWTPDWVAYVHRTCRDALNLPGDRDE